MSYYTKFQFKAKLKDPPAFINALVNNYEETWEKLHGKKVPTFSSVYDRPDLPIEHPFGKAVRWPDFFYNSAFDGTTLEIDCDINYGHEDIQMFVDWIKPYVRTRKKKLLIGRWKGEENSDWVNVYKTQD